MRLQVRSQLVVAVWWCVAGRDSGSGGDEGEREAALVEDEHGADQARGRGGIGGIRDRGGIGHGDEGPGVWEVEHGGDEGGAEVRVDGAEVREGVPMGKLEDGEVQVGGGDEVDVCVEKRGILEMAGSEWKGGKKRG